MRDKVSKPEPLKSEAGWYIGTTYESAFGGDLPYERLSQIYFPTKEKAKEALDSGEYVRKGGIENET